MEAQKEVSTNRLGLTKADYTGRPSTLCKGCGHDSITNAIISAYFEAGVQPWEVAKLSGIGCSSKTPTYFLEKSHGFNGVHGRMPSLATGAKVGNLKLSTIGVSGDGDTASIGLGQFCHLVRRNVDMVYIVENNGTYGLTKGQFSATADQGSKAKKGAANPYPVMDVCALAIELGATFVARSFSGDRKQVMTLLKAAHAHQGIAILDIISPCVTFNNHPGSTKSYNFVKDHDVPLHDLGFIPYFQEIEVELKDGEVKDVELHDGSHLTLKKLAKEYDFTNKIQALTTIEEARKSQTLVTGLLYYQAGQKDLNTLLNLCDTPLCQLTEKDLIPGPEVLKKFNASMR